MFKFVNRKNYFFGIKIERLSKNLGMSQLLIYTFLFFSFEYQANNKIDTTYTVTKHTNGKISTKTTKLTNEIHWGRALAFDKTGKEIYSMQIRNVAGHATVDFAFHSNGSVYTAHYTSHPDGGIQWSDIKHFFDENGNLVNVIDTSSDMFGHPTLQPTFHTDPYENPHPTPQIVIKEPIKKEPLPKEKTIQETVACAPIYSSEVFIINRTGRAIYVTTLAPNPVVQSKVELKIVQANDTLLTGSFIGAANFTPPKELIGFQLTDKKRNPLRVGVFELPFVQLSTEKRRYFYVVTP